MNSKDEAVLELCEEFWQWRIQDDPETSAYIGIEKFADCWQDISEEAYLRREDKIRGFLGQANDLDVTSCSQDVRLSHRLLVSDLDMYLKGSAYKSFLMPIGNMEGIQVEANFYISNMNFNTAGDFQKYLTRLQKLSTRISQVVETLKRGLSQGIVMYRSSLIDVPRVLDSLIENPVEELELFQPCLKEVPDVSDAFLQDIRVSAKVALTTLVQPAFRELKTFLLESYLPLCRPTPGLVSLPNGVAWYQQCLHYHLSYATTPQEVYDLGLKEVARIQARVSEVAMKEGLTTDLTKIKEEMKAKTKLFATKEEALAYVQDICYNRIHPQLHKYFKDIPPLPLRVVHAKEYQKNYPAGFYMGGTPDGSREGAYSINMYDLENKCLPFILPSLSLHEGEPGHHTQAAHGLAAKHLPNFRRFTEEYKYYLSPGKYAKHTAYLEGWGLYCEALGEEMGLYRDNLELLGRCSAELFRAARMVVDTGIHAFGWSREKAVDYLTRNTMIPEAEATREVDRYITWPGQACAYKYGELKIWELRRLAEKELGAKFDLREFHLILLSCGSVPMTVCEELVAEYISQTNQ